MAFKQEKIKAKNLKSAYKEILTNHKNKEIMKHITMIRPQKNKLGLYLLFIRGEKNSTNNQ